MKRPVFTGLNIPTMRLVTGRDSRFFDGYPRNSSTNSQSGWSADFTDASQEDTQRKIDPKDYYALLGLKELNTQATTAEVQRAFRREVMKYHPDHTRANSQAHADFCAQRTAHIIAAYTVLRNPDKRAAYDHLYKSQNWS